MKFVLSTRLLRFMRRDCKKVLKEKGEKKGMSIRRRVAGAEFMPRKKRKRDNGHTTTEWYIL